MRNKEMKYAVMFEIEHGQWEYMRENTAVFDNNTPVKVFDLLAAAQAAADTWNTGRVVEWHDGKDT